MFTKKYKIYFNGGDIVTQYALNNFDALILSMADRINHGKTKRAFNIEDENGYVFTVDKSLNLYNNK